MYRNVKTGYLKYLYIVSMTIAFIPRLGDIVVSRYIQLGIGVFWIMCALLDMVANRFKKVLNHDGNLLWLLGSYFVPTLIIHMWTIILMLFGVLEWDNLTSNITTYIPTLLAISSLYIFGKDTFRVNFFALALAYILSVFASIVLIGPGIITSGIKQSFGWPGTFSRNYLELHDIVLSIGFALVYYIFSIERITKKNLLVIMIALLIFILGLKRIAVFGVFCATLFHKIIKRLPLKTQYKACRMAGVVLMAGCFLFVWLLISGDRFWKLFGAIGINFTGRNYYWTELADRCRFSPTFLGLGRNYTYLLFSGELSYMRVGAAHSDILKMYAENGFFLFIYWLWHYLLTLTKRYKEKYSVDSAVLYFGISIYLFAVYFTDNVETYFASILFSIVVPASYALKCKEGLHKQTYQ